MNERAPEAGPVRELDLTSRLALGTKEVARALGVCERTVRNWMRSEGLPYARINGSVLVRTAALDRWLAERERVDTDRADELADEILSSVS